MWSPLTKLGRSVTWYVLLKPALGAQEAGVLVEGGRGALL